MVLLDVVRQLPGVRLIVAHVNHGIRQDATEDATLVRMVAMSHNLEYEETQLQLRSKPSEEEARTARYDFLRHISKKYNARAILTAHHKNDVIETALINLTRGTGWRGLSSLRSTEAIRRPFIAASKSDIEAYARQYGVLWRYDSTNDDARYLRNHIRHHVVPRMSAPVLEKLYAYIVRQSELTKQIDHEAYGWIKRSIFYSNSSASLPRYEFIMLPHNVAHELLQGVLRQVSGKSLPRPLANRALLFIKVAKSHKTFPIDAEWQLRALPREVIVERTPLVVS